MGGCECGCVCITQILLVDLVPVMPTLAEPKIVINILKTNSLSITKIECLGDHLVYLWLFFLTALVLTVPGIC